ncbi:MAG: altronate dehydratase family protein [Pirellulales bacterium]
MANSLVPEAIQLHPDDNVAIATRPLGGDSALKLGTLSVTLRQPIQLGHKLALRVIRRGERVLRYGQTIGFATEAIEPGDWVHVHNCAVGDFARDYASATETPTQPTPIRDRTFQGYRRADGRSGARNYLAVISSVNCSASVCKAISRKFTAELLRDYPQIDGVVAFTHGGGCGMSYRGAAHQVLNRTLAGIAKHPNIGGYLLIGLGCETGGIGYLMQDQNLVQIGGASGGGPGNFDTRSSNGISRGPIVLSMQDEGGTVATMEKGVRLVAQMLPKVNDVRRESIPASEIVLGTNCGGSDGNSGVTANPALGVASDMLVACGGTSILAETDEIYGAEHLLTRRAMSKEVADKLIERIEWWKWYSGIFGGQMDNNPSLGNKEGGLTTILEKSLGAVAKGGSTALVEVYHYAEPVTAKGLVVMDTPGLDAVSVTGIVAGGANVVVFTTGRGSCYGCKPTPSIKVATNTPMYERMIGDMDLDAGTILAGRTIQEVGRDIFEEILAVAGGKKTKSEHHGIGEEEFVPWNLGPIL